MIMQKITNNLFKRANDERVTLRRETLTDCSQNTQPDEWMCSAHTELSMSTEKSADESISLLRRGDEKKDQAQISEPGSLECDKRKEAGHPSVGGRGVLS